MLSKTEQPMMRKARYFKDAEFRRCEPPCSIEDMSQEFLDLLDRVRQEAGIPIVLNSAYRSPEWDRGKGRSGNGAHTKGLAVDIRCNSDSNRYKILAAAYKCRVNRIGVYRSWIHLDMGDKKGLTPNVVWYG